MKSNSILDINTRVKDIQSAYSKINGPESIMLDITQRCNLHCKHCYNCSHSKFSDDLSDEDMIEVVKQIIEVNPQSVCICGGEPTVRFDLCLKVAEMLTENDILVNMVTNGYKSDIKSLERLYKSGINSIQVSLDSYNPDIMNKFRESPIAYKNAVNAIYNILSLNNMPSVTFIPTKMNYKEMPLVGEFLYDLGVNELRYMPFIAIGRGRSNIDKLKLSPEENQELFWLLKSKSKELKGFKFDYGDPVEHIYLFRNNKEAFNPSYEIKSNGDISLTCYLPYIYGNVLKTNLKELWKNGLDNIWKVGYFHDIVSRMNTVEDFEKQKIIPYTNNDIDLYNKDLEGIYLYDN
ncbi:hypothetical protein B9N56_06755 [Finegoldia magna]|uniref:Radical SAM core domain-containing protein n=2 Tax=Finegoldia magna TaxID=1260 RepID=A0A233VY98_FINMA|nr:radical SAM protein [Finegoldia magna]MDU4277893.1 radical SAM protein [Finegoldia magna]OXZ37386.1 hypothetical protein B9N56_06755 [Finegoldia magna]